MIVPGGPLTVNAVIGVSPDTPAQQKKLDEKYGIGFPLLADTGHAMAEAYSVNADGAWNGPIG